jgi:hypothetical protein
MAVRQQATTTGVMAGSRSVAESREFIGRVTP